MCHHRRADFWSLCRECICSLNISCFFSLVVLFLIPTVKIQVFFEWEANVLFRFILFWFGFPSVLRTLPGLNRTVLETESPRNYLIVESALKRNITISPIGPENTLDTYYQPFLTHQQQTTKTSIYNGDEDKHTDKCFCQQQWDPLLFVTTKWPF